MADGTKQFKSGARDSFMRLLGLMSPRQFEAFSKRVAKVDDWQLQNCIDEEKAARKAEAKNG